MKPAKQWCEEVGLSEWRPRSLDKASQESAIHVVELIQADALRHAVQWLRTWGWPAQLEAEAEELEKQVKK